MQRKQYGSDDIISVYKFMEMCGLHCEVKPNIQVSHEIMMRKLRLRNKNFPEEVILPSIASFKKINKETVKKGSIVLVLDDCNNVIPYYNPRKWMNTTKLSEEEREERRKQLIEEQKDDYDYFEGERITTGLAKYINKRTKQELENEKQILLQLLAEDLKEGEYQITEKIDRETVKQHKKNYYY